MKQRMLAIFLAVCMLLGMMPGIQVTAETYSGTCGDDLTWTLDDNGTLTISGTGTMYEYSYSSVPWYAHRDHIETVAILENNEN